jgi:alpha-glucosidase
MSSKIFSDKEVFRFLKVEQYFSRYQEWDAIDRVNDHTFDSDSKSLKLEFTRRDGNPCSLFIQFPQKDTFRVRFNPGKTDYSAKNTRSVIQDSFDDLMRLLREYKEDFRIEATENDGSIEVTTKSEDGKPEMKVAVGFDPFTVEVINLSQGAPFGVWKTAQPSIYYTPHGSDDYAIIQTVSMPDTAKYIGFGEQGGQTLCKNGKQVNYFNFDNMRYRQVYDRGPLDSREPLYHSDPFFFEFNGVGEKESVNAIFIDNPGQLFVDIGYLDSKRYMFGSRFGDLDYYFFMGNNPLNVIDSFTSIVGRARLKPRYCLGYHQGCYGYDTRAAVEWAVAKYREYKIPLDGLHIDVDIQHNYQTFTIDEQKFPRPDEMFSNLKAQGMKCSTNITPVISKEDPNYSTYCQARDKNYFVLDKRFEPDNTEGKYYQLYSGGNDYCPNNGWVEGFNSGKPYIGGVYYGNDSSGKELGAAGHYADLGLKEVRRWWGTQYQYLFKMGLEMVWQDMTTPAIRDFRGDMKGFPFRLYVTDDFLSDTPPRQTPAIKVWNLYSYNLHKATYHGLNNDIEGRENKRNFIIGRGSFTGSHRFAGLWTGDNSSDWDFLKMNISQVLSLGMCGVVICGQDIGGFEASLDGGKWAGPELLIRWTVAGAFLPWFRNHYVRKGRKEFQEPFMYVEWFNEYRNGNVPEPKDLYYMVLPICKHYIELRYRLLQLFYDAMFENTLNGFPICRPLFLNDPGDKSLFNGNGKFLDNEFFVGKDLLVAPVLEPQVQASGNNDGNRDVYLPSGSKWYSFVDNAMPLFAPIDGGTTIRDFDANLNLNGNHIHFIVPLFVRAGAVIPTIELEQYVGQFNKEGKANPLTLNVYPGEKGDYTLYLDDGESRSSAEPDAHPLAYGGDEKAKGEYRKVHITHEYTGKAKRRINVKRIHDGYTPKFEHYFFVAVLHDPSEKIGKSGCLKGVGIGGRPIAFKSEGTLERRRNDVVADGGHAWYYDEYTNSSIIKILDDSPDITITVDYL